jgi:hypothetical protein
MELRYGWHSVVVFVAEKFVAFDFGRKLGFELALRILKYGGD